MEEQQVITVDKDTADAIYAVAKKTGMTDKEVVQKLLKLQLTDKPVDPMREKLQRMKESFGGGDGEKKSIVDKFVDSELINSFRGNKDDDDSLLDKKTLKMMFQMQMMQQMFPMGQQQQPQQQGMGFKEAIELAAIIGKPGGSDQLEKIMERQRHQDELRRRDDEKRQEQMMNMMREAITGKRVDEIEKKVLVTEEKAKEEQRAIQTETLAQMRDMENRLLLANKSGGGLSEELQQYSILRDSIMDFAKSEGMTKEEITDKATGKIKWDKLLKEGIDAVKVIGQSYAQRPPPPQPVIEMTPEEYEEYQKQAMEQAQAKEPIKEVPPEVPPEAMVEQPAEEEAVPVAESPPETQEIAFSPAGTVVEKPKKSKKKRK